MRNGFLGSLLMVLAGAGVATAQSYYPPYQAPSFPSWQNPPQAGYYNPYSVPPQAFPSWPNAPTMGAAYATPYQGQPQLPNYGSPQPSYSAYQAYQNMPRWPAPEPSPTPQTSSPLPSGPPLPPTTQTAPVTPLTPVTPPTPPAPTASAKPSQPMLNLSDGLVPPPPPPPTIAMPKSGTQLLHGDPVVDCPTCVAAPACPPPPSHEYFPPFCAPKGYCLYGNSQALSWWIKPQNVPPLLSTGSLFTPDNLIDNSQGLANQQHWGTRATLGVWIAPQQQLGLEVTGLYLVDRTPTLNMTSPGIATFGNSIVSATTQANTFLPVASGAAITGSARLETPSSLGSLEANLRRELFRTSCLHIDLLVGGRYLDLREGLDLTETSSFTSAAGALAGTQLSSSDRFRTNNQFYGGQIGSEVEWHWGRFFIDAWGKVAVGNMQENVSIGGTTLLTTAAGVSRATLGGVYAQGTNIGDHSRNELSAIPEVGVNFGLQLTARLRAMVGYSFLYIAEVVRPGDQIDRTVNLSQSTGTLVGPARPQFTFNSSDFWAHGVNLGLEFRY